MLVDITALFLGISILLYCLFAGADFGGGILECFLGRKYREAQKELITHAMGPVWEANHVWLILAVVILFNGFPTVYSQLSVTFHIPITIMLIGIIMRGCAFTFRHYDAVKDFRSQVYYSIIFRFSSILTPLMLGVIAGGMALGKVIPVGMVAGFHESYVSPWFNPFCLSVGIFTCVLFAFLAAVYLIGETTDDENISRELGRIFSRRAITTNVLAVLAGALVFLASEYEDFPLAQLFLNNPVARVCVVLATVILIPLWLMVYFRKIFLSRVLAALQMSLILLGWFGIQFPKMISMEWSFQSLTIYNSAAPLTTLFYLVIALIGGVFLIFPSLYYLLKVFKLLRVFKRSAKLDQQD